MNNKTKGVLTATIATVVTSVMILVGGTDSGQLSIEKDQLNDTVNITMEVIPVDKEITRSSIKPELNDLNVTYEKESDANVTAPPGPFSKDKVMLTKAKAEQVKSHTIQTPAASFVSEVSKEKSEPIKSIRPPNGEGLAENQKASKNQGDFVQKKRPKTNGNGRPIWMKIPDNSKGIKYMQQYGYVPTYPNYYYPQPPLHNGGYYFEPVPQQGMKKHIQAPF